MESSRRDLLNDVSEYRSILKNSENTYYLNFGFTPKTDIAFPITGVLFFTVKVNNVIRSHHDSMDRSKIDNLHLTSARLNLILPF